MQHKYRETVLFFPSQGQTCHAYCTFCFRWPQFVGMAELKFAMREGELLVEYLREHPEVTDVLFTGGDPDDHARPHLAAYIEPLLHADLPNLRTIRIGTKSLTYWPYRFLTDDDADDVLRLFERVGLAGMHLAIMAHFNHPAGAADGGTGGGHRPYPRDRRGDPHPVAADAPHQRRPSCLGHHVAAPGGSGLVPYYMFVARDTGAQHYFRLPLVRAWEIFREAYQQVSGVCRTVRGPSMSAEPGKIQVLGVNKIAGEKVFTLRFLQGRNPDWVHRPFFARFDPEATWWTDLKPAFGRERFFFEDEAEVSGRSGD